MNRPGSSLSRAKQTKSSVNSNVGISQNKIEKKTYTLEEFIKNRDWIGAITFLEFQTGVKDNTNENSLWLAYCSFHNGDYKKAINIYDDLMKKPNYDKELHI